MNRDELTSEQKELLLVLERVMGKSADKWGFREMAMAGVVIGIMGVARAHT